MSGVEKKLRFRRFFLALVFVAGSASSDAQAFREQNHSFEFSHGAKQSVMGRQTENQFADQPRLTIRGVRLTSGNGVNCSQVRAEDGKTYGVDRLPTSITIGQAIQVTGFMANKPTCLGPVLVAEEIKRLDK